MVLESLAIDVIPGITKTKAKYLSECAVSCLERQGHKSGVNMNCEGVVTTLEPVFWTTPFDVQLQRSTEDLQEATEHGAECISALFAIDHTPYTILERSRKGTGVDYWLCIKDDQLFNKAARLEISGILNDKDALDARVKQKLKQTGLSDGTTLPAYVSIVEFGNPIIVFLKK